MICHLIELNCHYDSDSNLKMAPVDNTPNVSMGDFQLLHSLNAYNKIPVSEYISKKTGLTVVIAEVDGPVVNGYFCLVTEAFDDDGLPHTLEHLIFLGSEEYPYKGVLDLLANRCLASGTNAWTDIDHTCYTMETAGSEGFLALMPIFLEHILYPVLTEEGFVTEVHHITESGEDAGVVYCEMQGRENSAESRLHLALARNIYPGKCGYSSETGGIMKNLRESTTNEKVRNYHKEFYRPENLKVIITGQVKPEEVFKSLEKLELKILSKGDRGAFQRPWQNPVPPIPESKDLVIKYPSDEENNGLFSMAWRGPSAVKDIYHLTASSLFLKYLTEFSVSPLPKEFVEIPDPYASKVCYNIYENAESCVYISFEDVPLKKLPEVREKLQEILKKMLNNEDIDMERLHSIINKYKLESLSNIENMPHNSVAFMIIGHMLYGNSREDLQQRVNPLVDLMKLLGEPKSFWLDLLKKYFVENKHVSVQCVPSIEEQQEMAKTEKERLDAQVATLGESGLKEKAGVLEAAIGHNDRDPPMDMLTSVPIPSTNSMNFHSVSRYRSDLDDKEKIDLSDTPIFTYFDHIKTNFVYLFAMLDTSSIPSELRAYLPLLLESLLELPVNRDGRIVPYEEVVAQLNHDTVCTEVGVGLGGGGRQTFKCGNYSSTVIVSMQVEAAKYEAGANWMREILYNTVFDAERLKVVAQKMLNSISAAKRSGRSVVAFLMKAMRYTEDSNVLKNSMFLQNKFLADVIQKINSGNGEELVYIFEKLRKMMTDPSNVVLYCSANIDSLADPVEPLKKIIPSDMQIVKKQQKLNVTPDFKLMKDDAEGGIKGAVIGMGCLESSFFYQSTKCLTSYTDPDFPALMLYLQYLIQAEGPMWKQIRGKGYAYGYSMMAKLNEGLLYLIFARATNVLGAYKETVDIVKKQLTSKQWDPTLLEAAKSSLIFEIIEEEKTIGNVVNLSVLSYFQGVDYKYNRTLLDLINKVTIEDLNKVGDLYVSKLFEPEKVRTAVVTVPAKVKEIVEGFKKFNLDVEGYSSLEESFLNK
ncbi:unnamed protein product [Brassicogethes aeneus]|uniref:Presequence protease, mitochondrial n=1 Tax=Brassicogethes aeneus TaxID=1431903 RepID=A0A9P0B917_BRAAE|nr:unnamed protein product [Brassicogethes aeneus]